MSWAKQSRANPSISTTPATTQTDSTNITTPFKVPRSPLANLHPQKPTYTHLGEVSNRMDPDDIQHDEQPKSYRYKNSLPDITFANPDDTESRSSTSATDENRSAEDLYQNLSHFTFGAPTVPQTVLADGDSEEFIGPLSDVTPRPSVAPHSSQAHPFDSYYGSTVGRQVNFSDAASQHTFGRAPSGHRLVNSSSTSLSSFTSNNHDPTTSWQTSVASETPSHDIAQFSSDEFDESGGEDFGGQPLTFSRDRLSSEEESDGEYLHHGAEGSYRHQYHHSGLPANLQHASTSSGASTYSQRRGSLPMSIPQSSPRDREGSLATLRRPSRSLDDDLRSFHAARESKSAGTDPKSEPSTRGDWRELESRMSISGAPSVKGKERADMAPPSFDMDWIKDLAGGITSFGPDGPSGSPAPSSSTQRKNSATPPWFRFVPGAGRRPSTATTGTNDDTFFKLVKHNDPMYTKRREEWTFQRERAEDGTVSRTPGDRLPHSDRHALQYLIGDMPVSPRGSVSAPSERTVGQDSSISGTTIDSRRREIRRTGMARGSEEVWRCAFVGRYKALRKEAHTKPDSSKPPQQRLDVEPFADPYSKVEGSINTTPFCVHKHSRALAFSIYRRPKPMMPPGRSRPIQHSASSYRNQIMLAPKRVQEQFTSTKTTSKLDTHGLLGDALPQPVNDESGSTVVGTWNGRSYRERTKSTIERDAKKENEKEKAKKKDKEDSDDRFSFRRKDKKKDSDRERETSSATSSIASSSAIPTSEPKVSPSSIPAIRTEVPSPPRRQASSKSLTTLASRDSTAVSENIPSMPQPQPTFYGTIRRMNSKHHLQSDADDDDEYTVGPRRTRTPHSEAFSAMEAGVVSRHHRTEHQIEAEGRSFISRFTRPLQKGTSIKEHGPNPAGKQKPYNPPWTVMAPRSQVEENEKVVADLNTSFQGVGLLPSRVNTRGRIRSHSSALPLRGSKKGNTVNIFEQVPEDTLYMLLPLWPNFLDSKQPSPKTKPEERQYLLVYYTSIPSPDKKPFASSSQERKRGGRSQTSSTNDDSSFAGTTSSMGYPQEHGILLTSFRCTARLVRYDELAGTNVLAPTEGLYVSGSRSHAMQNLPPRVQQSDAASDVVIAYCHSRDSGVEFIPEGFANLGLCYPQKTKPYYADGEEVEEDVFALTPIGRAAAEMAWLGCMALTSFGTA